MDVNLNNEKWMLVSNNRINWVKRRVFMTKMGKYLAWANAVTDDGADEIFNYTQWEYAKEIENEEYLFPKWEELVNISGYWIDTESEIENDKDLIPDEYDYNMFATRKLAEAALATAKVSQTYKRYRELLGEVDDLPVVIRYGLSNIAFRNESDWEKFYITNKEDLELIFNVSSTIQL